MSILKWLQHSNNIKTNYQIINYNSIWLNMMKNLNYNEISPIWEELQ